MSEVGTSEVQNISKVGAETAREGCTISDGKILVFGDTHFSFMYEGSHKNYLLDCYENMDLILDIVKKEQPTAIFFLGDIIGVKERNIKDHQFLMRVVMFFGMLYNITKGNVFSVRGNHDMGEFTDFDFLCGLGYIRNPKWVDYKHNGVTEIRFHFVNYGDEHDALEIDKGNASNVVLGHADYYIDGVTDWYSDKKNRVELKTLRNFAGVELVLAGHIHTPSKEVYSTTLPNGANVDLFYLGSMSRTAERNNNCWYVTFQYLEEESSTSYKAELIELKPCSEIMYDPEAYDKTEATLDEKKAEALDNIIKEIFECRLATGDLFGQIDRIPADQESKDLAKEYLRKAIDEK